jgi:hypothetical protein
MVTEDDAREKICPFTFSIAEQRTDDGCGIREAGPWPCLAARCMAWRWEHAGTGSCALLDRERR